MATVLTRRYMELQCIRGLLLDAVDGKRTAVVNDALARIDALAAAEHGTAQEQYVAAQIAKRKEQDKAAAKAPRGWQFAS